MNGPPREQLFAPYFAVGIALVGAGVIAVTPVAGIPRDVKVPNTVN